MRVFCLIVAALVTLASSAGAVSTAYNVTLAREAVRATGSGSATVLYDEVLDSLSVSTDRTELGGVTTVEEIHCCVATPGVGTVAVAITPNIVLDLTQTTTFTAGSMALARGTAGAAEAALFARMNAGRSYLNINSNLFPAGVIRGFLAVPEP